MTKKEASKLKHGLYRIKWSEDWGGGYSLAAVGSDSYGDPWFAPTHWTVVPSFTWKPVESARLIKAGQAKGRLEE